MPTLRGLVWAFCLYLSVVISDIAHIGRTIPAPHFDHSLNTLFLTVLSPIFCAWMVLYFAFGTKDRIVRIVGIISAIAFAFGILLRCISSNTSPLAFRITSQAGRGSSRPFCLVIEWTKF